MGISLLPRLARRLAAASVLLVLAIGLAACGGGDDTTIKNDPRVPTANFAAAVQGPEKAPALAVEEYVIARNTGDSDKLCDLTSVDDKALDRCHDELGNSFQAVTQISYELKSVDLKDASNADVFLIQTDPPQKKAAKSVTQFTMQKVDGDWKVQTVGFAAS